MLEVLYAMLMSTYMLWCVRALAAHALMLEPIFLFYFNFLVVFQVYSHILDDDGGIISAQPDVDHPHDISVTYAIYAIIGQLGIAIPPIVAVTGRRRW
jgi:hypothetical protein